MNDLHPSGDTFVLRAGSQHQASLGIVGLLAVSVRDGALVANVAVGTPQGRMRRVLGIGESMDVPGGGRLTLLDVHLGGAGGGAARFTVT